MNEAATPVENKEPISPTPPAATPAQPAAEQVTLTKEESDQLRRDAARASANQSKADRYDRLVGSGKITGHFKPTVPATPPSKEEQEEAAATEDRKAEKGLMGLALDPAYREVLDADPTLRSLLTTNPLSILPMYAPDALDAEDAVSLVKEKLSAKATELKAKATPPAIPPVTVTPAIPPATPPAGGVNPPGATTPDADYEAARKLPNTEHAIAGMVKQGLKKLGGK